MIEEVFKISNKFRTNTCSFNKYFLSKMIYGFFTHIVLVDVFFLNFICDIESLYLIRNKGRDIWPDRCLTIYISVDTFTEKNLKISCLSQGRARVQALFYD